MKLRVEVTQEDIDKGNRQSAWSCMIQRAVVRAAGDSFGEDDICVGGLGSAKSAFIGYGPMQAKDGYVWKVKLPGKARERARDFDEGLPVTPFKFSVVIPDEGVQG